MLHTVGYEAAGRGRSILYRGSLSEMVENATLLDAVMAGDDGRQFGARDEHARRGGGA
jgi:hypothetical protein